MIPFTTTPRPDTGVTNVSLGVWLFLASEVMLFGALFSAYALLRTTAVGWPAASSNPLNLTAAGVNTLVLLAVTALLWTAGRRLSPAPLVISLLLALAFLVVKMLEWQSELAAGLLPRTSTFLALYFLMTALHAIHVGGGAAAIAWVMRGVSRVPAAQTSGRLRALRLYWSFVDVIWLAIVVLFYFR